MKPFSAGERGIWGSANKKRRMVEIHSSIALEALDDRKEVSREGYAASANAGVLIAKMTGQGKERSQIQGGSRI